ACIKGAYTHSTKTFCQSVRVPNSLAWSLIGRHDVYCGIYASSGDLFFSGSHDGVIRIFDSFGAYLRLLEEIPCPNSYWSVVSLCLSPSERLLAYTILSSQIHLISLDKSGTRDRVKIVDDLSDQGSVSKTFSVCFDGTGTRLISGNDLGYLRIHDIESGACELTPSSNKRDMNAVTTLDAAGHFSLAGSDDTTIRVCPTRSTPGDGVYFLSNSKDQTVRLWDLRKHTQSGKDQFCRPRANWDYRVHSIPKTYTNPRHWHSGSSRGDQSVLTLRGHTVRYTLIRARFSPAHQTGQRYAYAGSTLDGWCIWDLFTGELIRRNSHGPHAVRDVYWHPWEPLAMASELNGSLSCWKSCTKDLVDADEAVHSDRARFELYDPDGGRYRNRLAESGLLYRFPNETEIGPLTSGSSQSTISDLHQDDVETVSSIDTDDSTLDTEYEYIVRGYSWAGSDESDPDFAMDVSDVQNYTNDMGENSHIPVTRSQTRGRGTRRCRRSRDINYPYACFRFHVLILSIFSSIDNMTLIGVRCLKWLECEFTDQNICGSNPTSASRLPLSRLGQPGSIPALVQPSGDMTVWHRKGTTAERRTNRCRFPVYIQKLVKSCTNLVISRFQVFTEAPCLDSPPLMLLMNWRPGLVVSFSCSTLSGPNCHATRRKHEGWDTARLPKHRQRRLSGRVLVVEWWFMQPSVCNVCSKPSIHFIRHFRVSDEVSARISKDRITFANLCHLWRQKGISLDLKGRVYQATVRAVLLYGCETWPLRVDDVRRLQVFDHRCLRSVAGFGWQRVSNAAIRKRVFGCVAGTSIRENIQYHRLR
ncbi:hypothetical protein T265_15392, partial [Opisthorchis viverrini]